MSHFLNTARAHGGWSHNASQISLHPVDDRSRLVSPTSTSFYGATRQSPQPHSRSSTKKLIFNATLKMAAIFLISCIVLGGVLWIALPTLDEQDRPKLRIPKSFDQLKELNSLLKKYRDIYPYRIVICFVTVYLFLQAFSLPGSMYLSILGGAMWGVPIALPLVCVCVATGASLCYAISAALGPALLTIPRFKSKLDRWAEKIQANKENVFSFLIVLRIAPFPPHWVVNVVCPHVGVDLVRFWITTALGIFGVSVIHTTIGGGLDDMTSPADFKLISWKNFLALAAIAVGVMIPVGIRWWFRPVVADIASTNEDEGGEGSIHPMRESSDGSRSGVIWRDDDHPLSLHDELSDDDDDIVLETGPSMSPRLGGRRVSIDQPFIWLSPR